MRSLDTSVQAHQSKFYYELSHFYDLVFGRIFYRRIAAVIRSLRIPPGAKVLELGVGTGLSLGAYPQHAQVIGVDLAPDMLEHAQEKIDRNRWKHVRLAAMDAMQLEFPDSSFDYVMAFHLVSVVPDAGRMMREAQRVCKPDGKIVVINHFLSDKPLLAALDRGLEPVTRRLGWHTLRRAEVFDRLPLELERIYKLPRRSLFTIVLAKNNKSASVAGNGAGINGNNAVAH
jgi:phosphatidylethanolamine/phosphatidyl-N-methylethanolamine N-methyltransferase